jgi:hypothetical protein
LGGKIVDLPPPNNFTGTNPPPKQPINNLHILTNGDQEIIIFWLRYNTPWRYISPQHTCSSSPSPIPPSTTHLSTTAGKREEEIIILFPTSSKRQENKNLIKLNDLVTHKNNGTAIIK